MQQQRQDFAPMFCVVANPLAGTCCPLHHWIDRFQMARVCRKANLHFGSLSELAHRPITKVILHVAVARDQVGNVVFGELGEDHLE